MRLLSAFVIGLVFGFRMILSGMSDPAKVVNFFDFAGTWDPSLAFVMAGALFVTAIGYTLVFRRPKPTSAYAFTLPETKNVDLRLIAGSVIFGIGWGISGFCPGGAIPALGVGLAETFWFVGAMIAGIWATRLALKIWN